MASNQDELRILVTAAVKDAVADLGDVEKQIGGVSKSAERFTAQAQKVGQTMNRAVTLPILGAAGAAVKFAADIEKQQVALKVLLGSAEEASAIFKEWQQFSASTPFQLDDITNAGKSLIAFGESADDVTETLRRIGDVSAGIGAPLGEIAEIYGKARVQQTLFAEDINQLAGRGIPIFTGLAEVLGVAESEVKSLASQGKVSFGDLEQVFENLTSEGGQFAGMMEELSETTAGKFSTAMDNLKAAAAGLGAELLPMVSDLLDSVTDAAEWFGALDDEGKKLILTIGGLAAAGGPILMTIGALGKLKAAIIAINTTALFGPLGIIVGLTAVAAGLVSIGRKRRESQLEEIAEEFSGVATSAGLAVEEIEAIENALRLGSMDGFGDASEQVEALAHNLGVSEAAVIDIGLASDNVTARYKEQLQLLRDQITEQVTLNSYQDAWIADARERAAADARSAEILRQREEDARRAAEAQAAIQDRADEAYENIERRLEEINRLEAFNLKINEEYNAEEERREAILSEVNKLISDGIGLNTSFAGALSYILELYGSILTATEEVGEKETEVINDSTAAYAEYYQARIEAAKAAAAEAVAAEEAAAQASIDAWKEYYDARIAGSQEVVEEELDNSTAMWEQYYRARIRAAEIAAQEELQIWTEAAIGMGTVLANEIENALTGKGGEESYNRFFEGIAKTLGDMIAPGVGDLIVGIGGAMREGLRQINSLFDGNDPAVGTQEYFDEVLDPLVDAEREIAEQRIEVLEDQLAKELELRNEHIEDLKREFNQEFDVLRDQWERNIIDTEEFQRRTQELNDDYDAGEVAANDPVIDAQDELAQMEAYLDEVERIKGLIEAEKANLESLGLFEGKARRDSRDRIAYLSELLTSILMAGAEGFTGQAKPGSSRGGKSAQGVSSAANGADFVTSGPQLMLVGDNASGREHVRVNPLDRPLGEGVTIVVQGDVYGVDDLYSRLEEAGRRLSRRGRVS